VITNDVHLATVPHWIAGTSSSSTNGRRSEVVDPATGHVLRLVELGDAAVVDTAVTSAGDSMTGSIWFKAHTVGDGSLLAIETGNIAGNDRAEILAYVDNVAGGITVRSFTDGSSFTGVPIASGLDASIWHELSFSLSYTGTSNEVSISIDGATPVVFDGSLKGYRDDLLAPYSESSRLKIRPRHTDGDLAFNGFYLDDLSYAVNAGVPEPASFVLLSLAVTGCMAVRRRRHA